MNCCQYAGPTSEGRGLRSLWRSARHGVLHGIRGAVRSSGWQKGSGRGREGGGEEWTSQVRSRHAWHGESGERREGRNRRTRGEEARRTKSARANSRARGCGGPRAPPAPCLPAARRPGGSRTPPRDPSSGANSLVEMRRLVLLLRPRLLLARRGGSRTPPCDPGRAAHGVKRALPVCGSWGAKGAEERERGIEGQQKRRVGDGGVEEKRRGKHHVGITLAEPAGDESSPAMQRTEQLLRKANVNPRAYRTAELVRTCAADHLGAQGSPSALSRNREVGDASGPRTANLLQMSKRLARVSGRASDIRHMFSSPLQYRSPGERGGENNNL